MAIQVTGILKDPLNQLSKNVLVRVTAKSTQGNTLKTAPAKLYTDKDTAAYDFELVEGTFDIEVIYGNQYNLVGTVVIEDGVTPSPITLPDLLNAI